MPRVSRTRAPPRRDRCRDRRAARRSPAASRTRRAPAASGASTWSRPPTECKLSATDGAVRDAHVQGQEHGRRRDRVLPPGRGRAAGRRPRSRTSARASPATSSCRSRPGTYHTACKPGMVGDGIRAAFTVTDSGASIGPSGDVAEAARGREGSYIAYVKDQAGTLIAGTQAFADAYAAGDDDTARDLYAGHRVALGADRARRGVVRRPRPAARRPRGGPRGGRTPGAAGTGSRRTCGRRRPTANGGETYVAADDRGARGRRGRPRGQHRGARRQGQRARLHVRGVPDRERRQGAPRRGRERQGHRRGGDLVAHRPVGLPGQRRRRVRRRSRCCATSPRPRTPSWSTTLDERFDGARRAARRRTARSRPASRATTS